MLQNYLTSRGTILNPITCTLCHSLAVTNSLSLFHFHAPNTHSNPHTHTPIFLAQLSSPTTEQNEKSVYYNYYAMHMAAAFLLHDKESVFVHSVARENVCVWWMLTSLSQTVPRGVKSPTALREVAVCVCVCVCARPGLTPPRLLGGKGGGVKRNGG